MKLKEVITEIYQRSGLWFINTIARSAAYKVDRDIAYGKHARQRLDHYRLADHADRPTVVFYYGGNWRSGSKEDYRFVADTLLAAGCNVIVPDYRLYPAVRFGDIREDAAAAFQHACELVPEQSIFVMGHSAGAQLGALLTLDAQTNVHHRRIMGFIGLAGPYDFYPFTEDDHWDLFAPEDHYPQSQAVNYVRADAAPLYLLHGEDDRRVRRGHSKSLMEKQQAAGGIAKREVYAKLGHVEIILAFSRVHRSNSAVVRDIRNFLQSEENDTNKINLKEASNGTK